MKVLLVEDNPADADLIWEALSDVAGEPSAGPGFELVHAHRLATGLEHLSRGDIGVVLLDLTLPDSHGFETFSRMRERAPNVPIVLLSGLDDRELAMRAVREGAQDYLVKGQVGGGLLARSLRYAVERKQAEDERARRMREQVARAEAESAQRRLAFLAEASKQLATSLECTETLKSVARLAVPTLADWCIVDMVVSDGSVQRVAAAHVDPRKDALVRELALYAPDRSRQHPLWEVLGTGSPMLLPSVTPELLAGLAQDATHLRLLEELGLRSVMLLPMVARGRTLGAIMLVTSESGRLYAEADLALAQELASRAALAADNALLYSEVQQQVRTRDEFLAAASHDLKNPLVAVKGVAQVLQRALARHGAIEPERLTRDLGRIDRAVSRMTALIDELLDVTRLQMGQPIELALEPIDLVALARQAAQDLQQTTELHRIRVQSSENLLTGEWDARRLERLLGNLLSNAVKYSPSGGDVDVFLSREEDPNGEWAVLSVRDHGVGIPASELTRVFERFQRAGNVVGRIPGTGVGLSSARWIVEQHGGSIQVESREGEETTFTVRLPLARQHAPASAGAAQPVS